MKIVKEVIGHWRRDWAENRLLFWIELIGVALSGTSTAILSFMVTTPPMLLCYVMWLFGSSLLGIGAYMRGSAWIAVLMSFYSLMNIVGVVTLVLR